MKNEIIKLLKEIETNDRNPYLLNKNPISLIGPDSNYDDYVEAFEIFKRDHLLFNDYDTFLEEAQSNVPVRQYMDFPNYNIIVKKIEHLYESKKVPFMDTLVLSQLKRMEKDGLILIGSQVIREYVIKYNPDFTVTLCGDGWSSETESVVLTTKGKSKYGYFWYQVEEQRFNVLALVISLAALVLSALAIIFNIG